MERNFLIRAFVCLFTVVALCSCSKDDDEENNQIPDNTFITVENGASYNGKIDVVKAETDTRNQDVIMFYSTLYENGGFKLELPESVSAQSLEDDYGDEPGVAISNPNVKTVSVYLDAYKSGSEIGYFYHGTGDWEGYFTYSDSDCDIRGSYTWEIYSGTHTRTYNLHLKEGWNMVYYKSTDDEENRLYEREETTQVPAGAKWYFYEWEGY
jgi:hypothetical protein